MLSEWRYEVVVEHQPEINATANDRMTCTFHTFFIHIHKIMNVKLFAEVVKSTICCRTDHGNLIYLT